MAQAPDPHAEQPAEAPVHEAPAARQAHAHGVSLNRLAFTATLHDYRSGRSSKPDGSRRHERRHRPSDRSGCPQDRGAEAN